MLSKHLLKKYLISSLLLTTVLQLGALGTAEKKPMPAESTPLTPQRIISLGPVLTEELYLLNAEEKLIGDTTYCINPPAARQKPKVGSVTEVDVEKLLSLKPDLVLATSLSNQAQMEKLKKIGLHVEVFSYPKSYQEICESFLRLARLVNREELARSIVDKSQKDAAVIKAKISTLTKKRVFVQVGANPLFTTPKNTFIHSFIEMAGGENIASDALTGLYSREKVLERNPDVILIATMGIVGTEEKETWEKYPTVNAVKNKRIFTFESYEICSPTPITFIKVLNELLPLLHPELSPNSQQVRPEPITGKKDAQGKADIHE